MRRSILACFAILVLAVMAPFVSSVCWAQAPGVPGGMPLVVDMSKVKVGSWAEYKMTMGGISLTSRWALVARNKRSNTIEMTTQGGPVAKPMILRMVLNADPTSDAKPPRPMVIQFGNEAPMFAPPETPAEKFQHPDPKDLIGQEEIKVAAGTFKTAHYRNKNEMGTVDVWVSDTVPPLGIVKVLTTPENDKSAPAAMQIPPATMELSAIGTGAKPAITKRPRRFDPKKMKGLVGAGAGAD